MPKLSVGFQSVLSIMVPEGNDFFEGSGQNLIWSGLDWSSQIWSGQNLDGKRSGLVWSGKNLVGLKSGLVWSSVSSSFATLS